MSYISRFNFSIILRILSILVIINAFFMSICSGVSYVYDRFGKWKELLVSALILIVIGLIGIFFNKKKTDALQKRDGFLIVTLGWIIMALAGSIPYLISQEINSLTDAFFETMSGFTTTGASILDDIEALDKGILLWRSLTQWIGGMGIIVLTIALLPILGIGGMQLFMAESPGLTYDKLKPRIQDTALRLWLVYVGLTIMQSILLFLGDMNLFEAINHSLTTMATGGFSTFNDSAISLSAYNQYIIILFMFLAGTNFSLIYLGIIGRGKKILQNEEFLTYTFAIILIVSFLFREISTLDTELEKSFRDGLFQTISILTTTGFVSSDYTQWTTFATVIIFVLLFIGGSAGSTAGGVKVIRYLVLTKNSLLEFRRQLYFNAVLPVRINGRAMKTELTYNVLAFIAIYMTIFFVVTACISFIGSIDLITALSATATSLGNVGPGFGSVGPVDNFAGLPDVSKWILAFTMLIGRLEIFTVLIIFTPSFWKG